jgi:hypothetical protein
MRVEGQDNGCACVAGRRRRLGSAPCQAATFAVLLALGTSALATEGGGSQYAVGVETHYSGLMFPPGFHQLVYYSHFGSSHSKDNDGNDNARLAYFKARSDAVATRLSYVWPGATWLGASVETRAAIAVPRLDISLGISRPAPLSPIDRSGTATGFGDLSFAPVLLGWHAGPLHQTLGVEFYLPTGAYNVAEPVNTGRNYLAAAPVYAVTWFPGSGVDLSAKLRFGINETNRATNYRSGNELTLEFSGNVRLNPSVALGLTGYLYQQVSDDEQNGGSVNGNGNRGRVRSIGPAITYNFSPTFGFIAKVQQEFNARNKAQGTRLWLQAKLPF